MFGREVKLIKGREKEQAPQKVGQKEILCRPLVENRLVIHMGTNVEQTCKPAHSLPQRAASVTTGTNSLVAMFTENQIGGHCNWNQPSGQLNAPQPNEPEASEYTCSEVRGGEKNNEPFQNCRK